MTRILQLTLILLCGCGYLHPGSSAGPFGQAIVSTNEVVSIMPAEQPVVMRTMAIPLDSIQPISTMVTIIPSVACDIQSSADLVNWTDMTNADTNGVTLPVQDELRLFRGVVRTAPILLGWDALNDPSVTGVYIYTGPASGDYSAKIATGIFGCAVPLPIFPTNYIAATTYDAHGNESDFSNEAVYSFPKPKLIISQ